MDAGVQRFAAKQGANAMDDEDDSALIAASRHDPAAFAVLYRKYVDVIYRYCHRRLGSREAAEDATSLTFTRALAALPRYRHGHGSFRSWIFAIAHNAIANEHRDGPSRMNRPIDEAGNIRDPAPGPDRIALRAEAEETLQFLLSHLSEDDRRLLELRLSGLSGPEIARVLGRSHGAVKVAQFRAISRLRGLIADRGLEGDADAT